MKSFLRVEMIWLPEQTTDKVGLLLKQLARSQELTQVVREATFGVNTASPSLLDLIFINKPHLLKSCSTLPQIADHCPTTVKLSLSGPAPPPHGQSLKSFSPGILRMRTSRV